MCERIVFPCRDALKPEFQKNSGSPTSAANIYANKHLVTRIVQDTISSLSMAYLTPENTSIMSTPSDDQDQKGQSMWEYMTNRRSRKQASLFFLGATFFTFSTLISKRATLARHRATYPLFYKPSNSPPPPINVRVEAVEALQFATMIAFSGTMMIGGGLLWAFDISSMEDIRAGVRRSIMRNSAVRAPGQAQKDKDFEAWLAETMAKRKANKEAEGAKDSKLRKEPGQKD